MAGGGGGKSDSCWGWVGGGVKSDSCWGYECEGIKLDICWGYEMSYKVFQDVSGVESDSFWEYEGGNLIHIGDVKGGGGI